MLFFVDFVVNPFFACLCVLCGEWVLHHIQRIDIHLEAHTRWQPQFSQ